jgi:hypothetical protein
MCLLARNAEATNWPNRDPIAEFGGNNLYEFVWNSPLDDYDMLGLAGGVFRGLPTTTVTGPYNGWWGRWGKVGLGGLIGAGIGGTGSLMMSHCADGNCSKSDCNSCCNKGFGLALGGAAIGAGTGCIGTGGILCGISVGIGLWNGYQAYDAYEACKKSCASKKN